MKQRIMNKCTNERHDGVECDCMPEECAYIGCTKEGHLSKRVGSSMYSYRVLTCDEHEKELYK